MKNLEAVDIGPGLHFVQEDHPDEIGEVIRSWYQGLKTLSSTASFPSIFGFGIRPKISARKG